ESRQGRALRHEPVDAGASTEQVHQGLRALHQDRATALLDQGRIADELQGVSQSALPVQENGAPGQRRAVPEGLREFPAGTAATPPAPFDFRPALLEIAQREQGRAEKTVHLAPVRLQAQDSAVTGRSLLELAELAEGAAQV